MPALQHNAILENPNGLNLILVATYERRIQAPLERVWENVLDWEHLPWLHRTSFDYVELDEGGDWGWRTWSNPEHTDHIELTKRDESGYVARNYRSGNQVSEIWTELTPGNDTTDIKVDFFFPDVSGDSQKRLKTAILTLYTKLWDEDEAMMMARQRRLSEKREPAPDFNLGDEAAIRALLTDGKTITFQLKQREFQLRLHEGEFIAYSSICPHLLGPLTDADLDGGIVQCPWHGYQFDIKTGACVSPETASCRLPAAPELETRDGNLIAIAR